MGQIEQRRRALADYFERMDDPAFVRTGIRELGLDDWESRTLHEAKELGVDSETTGWPSLLLESVVVHAKYREDLARLASASGKGEQNLGRLHHELISDAVFGQALMREGEQAVEAHIAAGERDQAQRISAFLEKLGRQIEQIQAQVKPEAVGTTTTERPDPPSRTRSAAADVSRKRRSLLRDELAALSELADGEDEFPVERHAGAESLGLEPRHRLILARALAGPGQPSDELLIEGVAFQARYLDAVEELRGDEPSPDRLRDLRVRMTSLTALGLALLEELQRAIDTRIREAKFDEAKPLSSFRNKLGQSVTQLRERIGPEAFKAAEKGAKNLVAPFEEAKVERPALAEQEPELAVYRREVRAPRYVPADVEPSQAKPLLIVLAAVVAIWAVFVMPRLFREPLPVLKTAQMPTSPAFLEMQARPPSLYVKVKGGVWSEMTEQERFEFVEQLGEQAKTAGYTGVHVRSTEGATVGQWLVKTGVRLVSPSRHPS